MDETLIDILKFMLGSKAWGGGEGGAGVGTKEIP